MSGLAWYLIEAAVAVVLLGGVVWLTWPHRDDADGFFAARPTVNMY